MIELSWRVREGLLGIVGKLRPEGTALVTEDVCFPPARIAEAARDLQALMAKHQFLPGVAGHAPTATCTSCSPRGLTTLPTGPLRGFMSDLVDLIIGKYDGSLKAEHGTGINMAPFVSHEWGDKATA